MLKISVITACFLPLALCFYVNRSQPIDQTLDLPQTGFSFVLASMALLVGGTKIIAGRGEELR